jgi:hypothetical protein
MIMELLMEFLCRKDVFYYLLHLYALHCHPNDPIESPYVIGHGANMGRSGDHPEVKKVLP